MSADSTINPPFVSCPVAVSFNGINTRVILGNPASGNFTGQLTIEAWLIPYAQDGLRNIVAHGYTHNPNAEVYFRIYDGKYQFGSWNGTDHFVQAAIPVGDLNSWVHLCGVYDGTNWILYRNGTQVAIAANTIGALTVNANWAIGARGDGGERFFKGLIRNVAIWKTARTSAQVLSDVYNSPRPEELTNLAGYWPLDEGSDTTAFDYSPNVSNGTIVNGAWFSPAPVIPNSLIFPGEPSNGFVSLGNPAKLNFTGQISVMAWIMVHKTDGLRNILAHGYTQAPNAEVYFRINSGKYQFGSWNGTDHFVQAPIPQEDAMTWVHLAGVYDGTNWKLFRNGVQLATNLDRTGAITVNDNWAVGARGNGTERFLASCVKGLSIWSTGLTQSAIQQVIRNGITGTEIGLQGYWPMNEGAGPDIMDYAPSPANGTLKKTGWYAMPPIPGWFLATANAPFQFMSIPVTLSFNDQLWTMAGQYQNSVYSSPNGIDWTEQTAHAGWSGRRSSAGVGFLGKIWIFGGDSVNGDQNDVWNSVNGKDWIQVTASAPWARRSGHNAVVFQNKIWLFGGGDHAGNVYNDLWSSVDGVNWIRATAVAGWSPRSGAGAGVFLGRIYICGGEYAGNSIGEVWSTADGASWRKETNPAWPSRFGAGVTAIDSKLYVIGGTNTATRDLSDVWVTSDGNSWAQLDSNAAWSPRIQMGCSVFRNRIYLVGGIVNLTFSSNVWYYVPNKKMM